jgi:hypothetical protein
VDEAALPGYPIDLRSQAMRARAAAGPYGDFEARAARVVARSTGLSVVMQDDNKSAKTPDFRIEHDGALVGLGEIVTTTAGPRADQLRAFAAGELEFNVPELACTSWVVVTPAARRSGLRGRLVEAFGALEARGDHRLLGSMPPPPAPPAEVLELARIGLTNIVCDPRARPGGGKVYGLPEGIEGPLTIDWNLCASWLDAFLCNDQCARKVAKLAGAKASSAQQHLYVGVTGIDPWPVHQMLLDDIAEIDLPAPNLPAGLTHLWLHEAEFPGGRVLAWWPGHGWLDVAAHWKTA